MSFLAENRAVRFLFVDDGSSDETWSRMEDIKSGAGDRIELLKLAENLGKGEAVRCGVLAGLQQNPSHIGYWDGDLATPLSEIPLFVSHAEESARSFIFGSRIQRLGADIRRHWYRHYPGRFIAFWINAILQLPVHDTQCGAKLIEADLAGRIFSTSFVSTWLFDVELFARIIGLVGRNQATNMIDEIPLKSWTDVGESKIALGYLPKIPIELVKIYLTYRQQLKY